MPKVFTSKSQKTGEIGEHLACRYLESKGFSILERNYTRKWGEIDIVALKGKVTHFVEVKSKTGDSKNSDDYRPEDNMHPWKIRRIQRTMQTCLLEKNIEEEWQFDLVVVTISKDSKDARIKFLENLVL
jgi:putative endonuclease